MATAFVVAVFAWFGFAIAVYSAGAAAVGMTVLIASAAVLQPQFLVFAIVRHLAGRSYGTAMRALLGACAWVGTEWLFPKLLADSLAHGLYPSAVLRQFADVAGMAGITFLLVLVNEAIAAAFSPLRSWQFQRTMLRPLGVALAIVLALVGYGQLRLAQLASSTSQEAPIRVGLVQSNIAAYDRLRREMGAYDAVRMVLDTHFAMSRASIERDHVDALLWSETVYPTTFGTPKSETGGELDAEVMEFAREIGVPLVFGAYDSDAEGEYNAAIFLDPSSTPASPKFDVYRKSRLFFLTEYVPEWMEGPLARSWMPWAGTWKPGPGARVIPLRLAGGREVPVLPLICLDDVDANLAIEGARLGARMILTMSNDSWFTEHTEGAHHHLVAAVFRSIETRLPQLRVTNNGVTAVIDASGEIVRSAGVGERAVVLGDLAPRDAEPTLLVAWGDWLGPAALVLLMLCSGAALLRPRRRESERTGDTVQTDRVAGDKVSRRGSRGRRE